MTDHATIVDTPLRPDRWLSRRLDRPCFRLDENDSFAPPPAPAFVWTRVRVAARATTLQRRGFDLIGVAVTLRRDGRPAPGRAAEGVIVRDATPDDEAAVVEISRRSFTASRFHADPRIDGVVADAIKADWAASWFHGHRGDGMSVVELDGQVCGFLLGDRRDVPPGPSTSLMLIDLVAVDESARGRGLCALLTDHALARRPAAAGVRVGTQLDNVAALRSYEKAGFVIEESAYVLHFHTPEASA